MWPTSLTLCEQIKSCKGENSCYGVVTRHVEPIVFDFPASPHTVVVTEQPAEGRTIEELTRIVNEEIMRGVPGALNDLFEGKFYRAIKEKNLYWTHFIKCPGRIRRKEGAEAIPLTPLSKIRR